MGVESLYWWLLFTIAMVLDQMSSGIDAKIRSPQYDKLSGFFFDVMVMSTLSYEERSMIMKRLMFLFGSNYDRHKRWLEICRDMLIHRVLKHIRNYLITASSEENKWIRYVALY